MSKTAMLTARLDPELKSRAEDILSRLGITAGGAITMLYKQIVLQRALPFPLTLHTQPPPDLDHMMRADFDCAMQLGDDAIREGRLTPAADAFDEIRASLPQ